MSESQKSAEDEFVKAKRSAWPPPLEVLGAFTSGAWRALIASEKDSEEVKSVVASTDAALRDELGLIVNAETLIVLAGSGTSLGMTQADGTKKAPSMGDLWSDVSALPEFSAVEGKLNADLVGSKNLEHVLSDAQARQALTPDDSDLANFVAAAEAKVLERCSFVDADTDVNTHEIFLRKVARRSTRLQRTQLFTTNYDLAFESAARRARFNVIDGFGYGGHEFDGGSFDLDYVRRRPNEQLALEPSVFHLLKLHGSVDWSADGAAVRKVSDAPENPVLIYPSASKYQLSYKQPYLEFMSRFQIALRQPDVGLILVGFGFNDDHLNAPIEAALRSNIGLRAVVVTPGARNGTRAESIKWVEDLIKRGDRRLSMFTGTFDDLVQRLPDTPPQEERDAHDERVSPRRMGGNR
ncbi:SIR2 family protein [Gordonia caeni]|uniref:SIR2 family protein n=1 Tax=Gordonia caeni TaxID=1007097 RepID=A0ABP7PHF4_9ACTN